jgi:hypothetical protein
MSPDQRFFFSDEISEISAETGNSVTPREIVVPVKKIGQFEFEHRSVSNKEHMRLQSYRILRRGGSDANMYDSAHGRVFDFPCRMNFLFTFSDFCCINT